MVCTEVVFLFRFKPLLLHPKAVPGRSDLFINFINNKMMRNTFNYTVRALADCLRITELQRMSRRRPAGHTFSYAQLLRCQKHRDTRNSRGQRC